MSEFGVKESKRVLRMVASRSPKCWAKQIFKRNNETLKAVNNLHAQIMPWPHLSLVTQVDLEYGCPHCLDLECANGCLWNNAIGSIDPDMAADGLVTPDIYPCCNVLFNGFSHTEICAQFMISVSYSADRVHVCTNYSPTNSAMAREAYIKQYMREYSNVVAFLKGHMAWTQYKCWGRYHKSAHYHKA